jgi:hypothetical protein
VQRRKQRPFRKIAREFLGVLAAGILVSFICGYLIWQYSEIPDVYKSVIGPVGCASPKTNWQRMPISRPVCQEILRGRYEVIWVAPSGEKQ